MSLEPLEMYVDELMSLLVVGTESECAVAREELDRRAIEAAEDERWRRAS